MHYEGPVTRKFNEMYCGRENYAVQVVLYLSVYYDAALWSNFHVGMLNKLRSCYNRCIKIFFFFKKQIDKMQSYNTVE